MGEAVREDVMVTLEGDRCELAVVVLESTEVGLLGGWVPASLG